VPRVARQQRSDLSGRPHRNRPRRPSRQSRPRARWGRVPDRRKSTLVVHPNRWGADVNGYERATAHHAVRARTRRGSPPSGMWQQLKDGWAVVAVSSTDLPFSSAIAIPAKIGRAGRGVEPSAVNVFGDSERSPRAAPDWSFDLPHCDTPTSAGCTDTGGDARTFDATDPQLHGDAGCTRRCAARSACECGLFRRRDRHCGAFRRVRTCP